MNFKKIALTTLLYLIIGVNYVNASTLDCSKVLSYGQTGNDVKTLQRILNNTENCNLEIDGSFGNKTKSCVLKYQKNHNLDTDGIVGPLTCKSLNSTLSSNTDKIIKKSPSISSDSNLVNLVNSNLKKGNTGNNVKLLQKELNKVMNCNLEVDGSYGNDTCSCVEKFQSSKSLTKTGKVDSSTRKALNKAYKYKQGIINANNVNLRSGAGTENSVINLLYRGDTLAIISAKKVSGKTWYYVTNGIVTGYVISNYLSTTFIEIDINSQVLRLYVNGNLYLDTIITTGRMDGNHDTPTNYYTITNKSKNITLERYNSYVNYWIGIDNYGSIGIHDASWRGTEESYSYYGGTIYQNINKEAGSKYSGSHGCINTPYNKIKKIYSKVSIGTPVNIY